MQLEIKTIIDFGDDGPPADAMNSIMRLTAERLQGHVVAPLAAAHRVTVDTNMGWTSSGDGEE
jgi:hypothetical protein